MTHSSGSSWPDISFTAWRDTCAALHLFSQIVGKYRLARTPWVNHSWHATLYVNARGLTTSMVPDASSGIEVSFDLVDHRLVVRPAGGKLAASFPLEPMPVAEFHRRFISLLESAGGNPRFNGRPNEVIDPVPFRQDTRPRPYDAEAVARFHQALVLIQQVFQRFRTGFIGKVSPVHLFWGSFDLAVTRFSGRGAPLHGGGIPALPDAVTQEAYSHEVSSAGFWPGGGPIDEAAFYSYAYPTPAGFDAAEVAPRDAYYDRSAGEFILPYAVVKDAPDPEAMLMSFLESTYTAAANLGRWDRSALECATGEPGKPRPL